MIVVVVVVVLLVTEHLAARLKDVEYIRSKVEEGLPEVPRFLKLHKHIHVFTVVFLLAKNVVGEIVKDYEIRKVGPNDGKRDFSRMCV